MIFVWNYIQKYIQIIIVRGKFLLLLSSNLILDSAVPGLSIEPRPSNSSNDSIIYYLKLSSDNMEPGDPNFDLAVRMQNYVKRNFDEKNPQGKQVAKLEYHIKVVVEFGKPSER